MLNVQLRSPTHISHGIGDHYIPIDFTGWRYFELIEPEGERHAEYPWPYGGIYSIYRESVNYGQVASLGLWYNNLPPGKHGLLPQPDQGAAAGLHEACQPGRNDRRNSDRLPG